ncbi:hypothetical protein THAOC_26708 [Thalassiosira oceanica]|uniref:Uncharacterized protein n=1 Tax=Thalassiosira oceanica TaxID=159749 RepID=K0RNG4_THAOC|nr:hypothetical protein THAOC_26708 [Thalassiosira oceanica]|eukprot:EJK53779.1 hypothetical protein THAOC_26708 [Thalassiosira oceanica]
MTQIATKLDRVSNTEWKLDILRPFRVAGASNQQPAAKKMKTCDDKAMLLKVFPEAIVAYDNAVQDQSDLGGDSLAKNIISFKDMDKDCIRAILFVSFDKYVPKSWARKNLPLNLRRISWTNLIGGARRGEIFGQTIVHLLKLASAPFSATKSKHVPWYIADPCVWSIPNPEHEDYIIWKFSWFDQ